MLRVAITTTIATRGGGNVWFPAEVEGVQSVDQVHERLIVDRCLLAQRLETQVVDGKRTIRARHPVIVGVNGLATVTPLHLVMSEIADPSDN